MKKSPAKQRFLAAALAGASLLGVGANASAAGVSVSALNDVFGIFNAQPFDTTSNTLLFAPTLVDPNIGLTSFAASSVNGVGTLGPLGIKYDTVSVTFKADPGMKITNIAFGEKGTFVRLGDSAATYAGGSIVVNGSAPVTFVPVPLETNQQGSANVTDWDVGFTTPISFQVNGDTATVVFTNILAALTAPGTQDIAIISKKLAAIHVDVAAVPLPPALWMLGSALVGLVTVGRRKAEG